MRRGVYLHTRRLPKRKYCWVCGCWVGTTRGRYFDPRPRFGAERYGHYYCRDHA